DGIDALEANIQPSGIAVGPDGRLYFGSRSRLRFIDTDGRVQTVVGPDEGTLSSITVPQIGFAVPFNFVEVTRSPEGNLYAISRQRIWSVTPQGDLNVVVGGLEA